MSMDSESEAQMTAEVALDHWPGRIMSYWYWDMDQSIYQNAENKV